MTESPYFEALHLQKHWNSPEREFTVDFSLSVEQGTMTALLGPSGCGKSTVLRMIAGLLPPDTAGGVFPVLRLDGRDLIPVPPGKRGIGMVFQNHALFPHMRTDDNVGYGLRCRGISRKESRRRAEAFLERFGLDGFASRKPESLSGGEAQRVSLARTLIVEPKLVLFDEPLSALDTPLRRRLAADICGMQKSCGFTGLFVTHDIAEAKAVAGRIIVMKEGRIVQDCPATDFTGVE